MRKALISFLLLITASIQPIAAEIQKKHFTVGIVPQFEARKLHGIWRPVLDILEKETGYTFKLRGAPTIPEFEKEFIAGKFDFAYMNPYHLVMANEAAGYIPLVRDHGRKLYGVLVVRADSNIKVPKDLMGKTIAFPAPNALGASLQMRQELHDKFSIAINPHYVKTHDSVYLNVLLGKTAAGGGVQKTLNRQRPEYKEALRVIHTTDKVSPHPFAVLPSVPDEVKNAVQQALLKIGKTEQGKKLLSGIPIKEIGTASISDYLPLKKLGLERFFIMSE